MSAEKIAEYLSGVYQELVEGRPYSDLLRLDISTAAARSRAKRLIIALRDGEGIVPNSFIRKWWVADAAGLREHAFPLPHGMLPEGHEIENPIITFISDGRRVRFCASLGPNWTAFKVGFLNQDGEGLTESLIDGFTID